MRGRRRRPPPRAARIRQPPPPRPATPPPPGPLPPGPATPTAQLRVGFGGLVDTIEVSAVEHLPLRAAALVAPDGTIVPANYITVSDNPRITTGQWSLVQPLG